MCGGGNDRASREAQRAEDARRRQIAETTAAIDEAFSGRGSQLDEFVNALREQFGRDASRKKGIADRRLKFSLARSGLTGGSAQTDAGRTLGREFQDALLKAEQRVQGSRADLEAADEASRQQLVALAQGGAGLSSSVNAAAQMLRSNIGNARSQGLATDLGDIFTQTRGLYTAAEEAAARRRGIQDSEIYGDPFGG